MCGTSRKEFVHQGNIEPGQRRVFGEEIARAQNLAQQRGDRAR